MKFFGQRLKSSAYFENFLAGRVKIVLPSAFWSKFADFFMVNGEQLLCRRDGVSRQTPPFGITVENVLIFLISYDKIHFML